MPYKGKKEFRDEMAVELKTGGRKIDLATLNRWDQGLAIPGLGVRKAGGRRAGYVLGALRPQICESRSHPLRWDFLGCKEFPRCVPVDDLPRRMWMRFVVVLGDDAGYQTRERHEKRRRG